MLRQAGAALASWRRFTSAWRSEAQQEYLQEVLEEKENAALASQTIRLPPELDSDALAGTPPPWRQTFLSGSVPPVYLEAASQSFSTFTSGSGFTATSAVLVNPPPPGFCEVALVFSPQLAPLKGAGGRLGAHKACKSLLKHSPAVPA